MFFVMPVKSFAHVVGSYINRDPCVGFWRQPQKSQLVANNAIQHYDALQYSEGARMTTLTITARGQVTFRKEVLQHLGIKPGEKIELDLLPDGRAELKAIPQKGALRNLAGFLKGKTNGKVLTIDEIDIAIADANAAAGAGQA